MKLRRFCSKCGNRFTATDKIYEGFICEKCTGKKPIESNLPGKIQLRQCVHCKAFSLKKDDQEFEWCYQPNDEPAIDFLTRILYERIFIPLEKKHNRNYELFFEQELDIHKDFDINLVVRTSSNDVINTAEESIRIRRKEIHCPYCAKKKGGRFDAIVQIRIQSPRDKLKLDELMFECKKIEDTENFQRIQNYISKISYTINGFDLMVSTNAMARVLIAKLRGKYHFEIKISKKLIGVDQEKGSDLYRLTTLLRLLPVVPKDRIKIEQMDYIVKKITRNKVVLQTEDGGKVTQVNYDIFQKKKWTLIDEE
ncbi:hypothetical protein NEF87_002659 [Candidatus Lokiarchaeum ossiferum]|uniref:Nmd3 N-terminal domain-containing protein n=1 Tax=Candidatus Lokiarchaeum ossiferum TaxID=2951803 RepID=A0ABY6HS81_9ARCH|nr:hypothetical protein NEF87_002659 [Candidatus Lokiarchaeum sp. B-35]